MQEIKMPSAGQTTDEATIVTVNVKVGDTVKRGDVLCEAETDKAVLPVESFAAGTALAVLVQAADSISGARPGARKELLENYVKRLEDLEGIATSFDGVTKAYAIQAGREIRVMVNSENVDDDTTYILCKDIAEKIEKNLTYPGQIRVTVIRERRAVGFAK